jgi:hypothetical protein
MLRQNTLCSHGSPSSLCYAKHSGSWAVACPRQHALVGHAAQNHARLLALLAVRSPMRHSVGPFITARQASPGASAILFWAISPARQQQQSQLHV